MTDNRALREKLDDLSNKLDAIVQAEQPYHTYHDYRRALRAVALDLLREKEQRETPCVWSKVGPLAHETACRLVTPVPPLKFCPGCGHPVQVKQKEGE